METREGKGLVHFTSRRDRGRSGHMALATRWRLLAMGILDQIGCQEPQVGPPSSLFHATSAFLLWTEWCPHPNSFVGVLTSNVPVLRDRAFREVVRLNEVIRVGSCPNRLSVLIKDTSELAFYLTM